MRADISTYVLLGYAYKVRFRSDGRLLSVYGRMKHGTEKHFDTGRTVAKRVAAIARQRLEALGAFCPTKEA